VGKMLLTEPGFLDRITEDIFRASPSLTNVIVVVVVAVDPSLVKRVVECEVVDVSCCCCCRSRGCSILAAADHQTRLKKKKETSIKPNRFEFKSDQIDVCDAVLRDQASDDGGGTRTIAL